MLLWYNDCVRSSLHIRVAYLAKELLHSLCENAKEYERELDICDRDKFCIQIAALCHDLGEYSNMMLLLCPPVSLYI